MEDLRTVTTGDLMKKLRAAATSWGLHDSYTVRNASRACECWAYVEGSDKKIQRYAPTPDDAMRHVLRALEGAYK